MTPKVEAMQAEVLARCLRSKSELGVFGVSTLLQTLAGSQIGEKATSEVLKRDDLSEFELIILNNLSQHAQRSDVASSLAGLVKLGHLPEKVLVEVQQQNQLTILQPEGSLVLLRQLIGAGCKHLPELYEKLWQRVMTGDPSLPKRCDRTWFQETFCDGHSFDEAEPVWKHVVGSARAP